jgi:hypothetical protein
MIVSVVDEAPLAELPGNVAVTGIGVDDKAAARCLVVVAKAALVTKLVKSQSVRKLFLP